MRDHPNTLVWAAAIVCGLWIVGPACQARSDGPIAAAVAAGGAESDTWRPAELPDLPRFHGTPTQRMALAIARVAANETSMRSDADVALIHQTTHRHGASRAERYRWLRRHSRRVLAGECDPAKHGNCAWSRQLTWGAHKPADWPKHAPWRPSQWLRVLRIAFALETGALEHTPCPQPPWSWGGAMDRARALEHGLVPLDCEGTLNEGYALHQGAVLASSR